MSIDSIGAPYAAALRRAVPGDADSNSPAAATPPPKFGAGGYRSWPMSGGDPQLPQPWDSRFGRRDLYIYTFMYIYIYNIYNKLSNGFWSDRW